MRAEVEQPDGSYKREERGEPECGKDFCDTCGDCLHCYGGEECYPRGEAEGQHRWVIYLNH